MEKNHNLVGEVFQVEKIRVLDLSYARFIMLLSLLIRDSDKLNI